MNTENKIYVALAVGLAILESDYFTEKVLKNDVTKQLTLMAVYGGFSFISGGYLLYKTGLAPETGIKIMGSTLVGATLASTIDGLGLLASGVPPEKVAVNHLSKESDLMATAKENLNEGSL